MTNTELRKRTCDFITRWTNRGYEKGESQTFWLDLLSLLGIESPADFIRFEGQVHLDHTSFIDGFIPSTHVLIEQKSLGKDLRSPIKQSDGTLLTPFQQAKRYSAELPYDDRPRWIVTCNFQEFLVYDMNQPNGEPMSILLKNLAKELYRLNFLVKTQSEALQREMEISLAAGELVGRLYDALLEQYIDPTSPHALKSLNALCVRLVFCLYAEDAGLFAKHNAFHDYLASFNPDNVRKALIDLFKMLDTPVKDRDPYERPELLAFPYVNGGLFRDESIEIPRFTSAISHLLLKDCSADFDWSGISPTIFGAVFESTLNPETRRIGGMHYTSIENIHKVIDPLFLDDLTEELDSIAAITQSKRRNSQLNWFQDKLSSLTFLDPACGSGNFLTETFLSLRRLENRVLRLLRGDSRQITLGGDFSPIKVSISQFYGIEINDFAATVAKTALWIAESQMMRETEDIVGRDLDFLPLKTYTNITEGNALRLDWHTVLGARALLSSHSDPGTTTLLSLQTSYEGRSALAPDLSYEDKSVLAPGALHNDKSVVAPGMLISDDMFLKRSEYVNVTTGVNLPHWESMDKIQYITFRLADSLPQTKLNEWRSEKDDWLRQHHKPWTDADATEYYTKFGAKIEAWLDANYGSCVLRNKAVAEIVEETLHYYDGVQYNLIAYVIMPNHVHILVQILPDYDTAHIVKSWKGVSANRINKLQGSTGVLWEKDYFDRLIRSKAHLEQVIKYIEHNYTNGGASLFSPSLGARTLLSSHSGSSTTNTTARVPLPPETMEPQPSQTSTPMQRQECRCPSRPTYIMGNPPFVGARLMNQEQKDDMISVFGAKWKNVGNMDYVSCWYKKAAELIRGTDIHAALVSTNSICQGEQVPNLWKPLFADGIRIDFAHRTFRWDSEAKLKAHVHCVIVGFSSSDAPRSEGTLALAHQLSSSEHNGRSAVAPVSDSTLALAHQLSNSEHNGRSAVAPVIFDGETKREARHINAYLIDADDVFVESRSTPLCAVPPIGIGNKPIDGGNYLFTKEEMEEFIRREPASAKYFKPWYGSEEFIHRTPRYCLWLGDCTPAEINRMPECKKRVAAVREFRLASRSEGTRKLADKPTRFHVENMPKDNYLLIPRVSSERRRYVPIGFMQPGELTSDSCHLIPNATLYHFGVLTSSVHMAWMRAVCGRLKSDYRYSKDIVYNNFPWPRSEGTLALAQQSNCTQYNGRSAVAPGNEDTPVLAQQLNSSESNGKSAVAPWVHRIEETAQAILDARALYPDSSLADLYDETLMPPELRKAHQMNDRAVMQAYGFPTQDFTESDCVARLMQMYQELTR